MSEEKEIREISEGEMEEILRSFHPILNNQDGACPHIEWMGEDLAQAPGVGEWKCRLQEERYGDVMAGGGSENLDYKPCNNPNHESCSVYLASQLRNKAT